MIKIVLLALTAALSCTTAFAETQNGPQPTVTARIVSYRIDQPARNAGQQTGNLHILYDDESDIVETLPQKEKGTETESVMRQVSFGDVKIADNQNIIGWVENFEADGQSYTMPLVLSVYQSDKPALQFRTDQVIWYWMFNKSGSQIIVVWGPMHFANSLDYRLYDSATGKMLAETFSTEPMQALAPTAPAWARQAEKAMNRSN